MESRQDVMSHQGELRATPAGKGTSTSEPLKRTCGGLSGDERCSWRMSWRREAERLAPAESPEIITFDGSVGGCGDPAGG